MFGNIFRNKKIIKNNKKRKGENMEELTKEIIHKIENDLRKYPDWILRVEAAGLGITSSAYKDFKTYDFKSLVEKSAEYDEEIKRKIIAIESVYDKRLSEKRKKLIDLRYFQNEPRYVVMQELNIKDKNEYYRIRDWAMLSFARVLGYLKDE